MGVLCAYVSACVEVLYPSFCSLELNLELPSAGTTSTVHESDVS